MQLFSLLQIASKLRLEMKIEEILKPKKSARRGKKKANEEVLDTIADDEVARLRESMNAAAEEDQRANIEKLPALAKLKLLPEAMETLQKHVSSLLTFSKCLLSCPWQSFSCSIHDRQ